MLQYKYNLPNLHYLSPKGFSEEIAVDPKSSQHCFRKHHTTSQFRSIAPSRPDARSLNVVRYSSHDQTFNLQTAVIGTFVD